MSQLDVLIVGAGLTGLNLAYELQQKSTATKFQVLEKSRGCGGRMATRRAGDIKYDHGAQFIKRSEISQKLIDLWEAQGVAHPFPASQFDSVCGQSGMTALAKTLVSSLVSTPQAVVYDVRATALAKTTGGWRVTTQVADSVGPEFEAKKVVLTCPLPQSLELLKNSQLSLEAAHAGLSQIQYSKALVFLIESEAVPASAVSSPQNTLTAYQEKVNEHIFSLTSQQAKGQASVPAWTVVMSDVWSESYFEKSDDEILKQAQPILLKTWPELRIKNIQLKKWRYCQPKTAHSELFAQTHSNLYLAGDAFGGASLLGALRSSYGVLTHLGST